MFFFVIAFVHLIGRAMILSLKTVNTMITYNFTIMLHIYIHDGEIVIVVLTFFKLAIMHAQYTTNKRLKYEGVTKIDENFQK